MYVGTVVITSFVAVIGSPKRKSTPFRTNQFDLSSCPAWHDGGEITQHLQACGRNNKARPNGESLDPPKLSMQKETRRRTFGKSFSTPKQCPDAIVFRYSIVKTRKQQGMTMLVPDGTHHHMFSSLPGPPNHTCRQTKSQHTGLMEDSCAIPPVSSSRFFLPAPTNNRTNHRGMDPWRASFASCTRLRTGSWWCTRSVGGENSPRRNHDTPENKSP